MSATAAAPVVSESSIHYIIEVLFGIIGTLAAIIYRNHLKQYEDDKKAAERRSIDLGHAAKELAAMKELNIARQVDHERSDRELWEEIKESRTGSKRLNEEFWKQLNSVKERQTQLELVMNRTYHTKEEIADLLSDKLEPVLDALRELRTHMNRGPK